MLPIGEKDEYLHFHPPNGLCGLCNCHTTTTTTSGGGGSGDVMVMMMVVVLVVQATEERGRCDRCSTSARFLTVRYVRCVQVCVCVRVAVPVWFAAPFCRS